MKSRILSNPIISGTILLTISGFLVRILGFFYRIFLSRTIGAAGIGIYHMVFPVYGVCLSFCAGAIQTAISRFTAANQKDGHKVLFSGLCISFSFSIVLALLVYKNSSFIAANFLMEPVCASYLPFIAAAVPFASVHACISGYYYGMQKAKVPAVSQLIEQLIRISFVLILAHLLIKNGKQVTVRLAVSGMLAGEIISCLYIILVYKLSSSFPAKPLDHSGKSSYLLSLLTMALPLIGNRLVLSILQSTEAIWIPKSLQLSGLSGQMAFSTYGCLTGMALPFILFPSALTNAASVMLLPTISKAQSEGNDQKINKMITLSIYFCIYMGIFFTGIFTTYGKTLGINIFKNAEAGNYIHILAWLCPFLYISSTTGSILNGLGKTSTTFRHHVVSTLIRLFFVIAGIPFYGIYSYLVGLLISEILLAVLNVLILKRQFDYAWNAYPMILLPGISIFLSVGISKLFFHIYPFTDKIPQLLKTGGEIFFILFIYLGLLITFLYKIFSHWIKNIQ